jgi:hypothetical protein
LLFLNDGARASTEEQDAARARGQVEAFAAERGMQIASWYVENESGATLARPELSRLLADSHPGDVLLIEQVDRLSRLKLEDWQNLKAELAARCHSACNIGSDSLLMIFAGDLGFSNGESTSCELAFKFRHLCLVGWRLTAQVIQRTRLF